jgi:glycosyltransferase involved in cell wall biosynthesis
MERGLAYVSLDMYYALSEKHDVCVLTRPGSKPVGPEWNVPNVTYGGGRNFQFPLDWAMRQEVDVLIFNERHDYANLAKLRGHGFKLVCLHEWESVDPAPKMVNAQNACWDAIIAPTKCATDAFRQMGLENVYHVPWGTDLKLFRPPDEPRSGPIRFFQPANFGGVKGRKNVKATRQAWAKADKVDATLMLALQREGEDENGDISTRRGTLLRDDYAKLYRQADVVLLPSMWEGLGLCFMEAMASGCAIVTVAAPPMCDYVATGVNGWCCTTTLRDGVGGIYVKRALIDVPDYVRVIEYLAAMKTLTRVMGKESRKWAEERYDWAVNGAMLVEAIEEIADG